MATKAPPKKIAHLDELKSEEFLRICELLRNGKAEISEKLDGSARVEFGVKEGKVWTRSKYGTVKTESRQYPNKPMYRALRAAHEALETKAKQIAENWPAGLQYVVAEVAQVVPKPSRFTFEQASGIPIAGMAAYGAAEAANIKPGQRVAIIGAAGGAGSAAVDVVHAMGGKVIASGHSSQEAWLKQQGVEEFVAYDKQNVAARIRNVDAVLNMVDGQAAPALAYVKRGGMLTSIAGPPPDEQCAAAGVTCVQIRATAPGSSIGDTLRALVKLADAGKYTVRVTKVFPLAQAAEAQQFAHAGDSVGKVILSLDTRSKDR